MKRNGCFFGFIVFLFAVIANSTIAAQVPGSLEGYWQGGRQRLIFLGSRMFVGDEYDNDGEFNSLMIRQVTNREIRIFYPHEDEDEVMYYKLRGNILFLYETEEDYNGETGTLVFARIANISKSPLEGVWEGDDIQIEFTGNMMIFDETDTYEFAYTNKQIQFADENWDYQISGGTLLLNISNNEEYVFVKK
jgi:hypothetical protein